MHVTYHDLAPRQTRQKKRRYRSLLLSLLLHGGALLVMLALSSAPQGQGTQQHNTLTAHLVVLNTSTAIETPKAEALTETELDEKIERHEEIAPQAFNESDVKMEQVAAPPRKIAAKKYSPKKQTHQTTPFAPTSPKNSAVAQEAKVNKKSDASSTTAHETTDRRYQPLPRYSEKALAMRREGHVTVRFDIDKHGKVIHLKIIDSIPTRLFDKDVRLALSQWRYPPREQRGVIITFRFQLEQQSISIDE